MSSAKSSGQRPAWPQPQNRTDTDAGQGQDRYAQQYPEQAGYGQREPMSAGQQPPAGTRRQWPQPNQQPQQRSPNPYPDTQLRSPWPQDRQPVQRPADPLNRGEQPTPPRQRPVFGPRAEPTSAPPQYAAPGYPPAHEPPRQAPPANDPRYPGYAGARNEPSAYQQPRPAAGGVQGRPSPQAGRPAAPPPGYGRPEAYRDQPAGGYPPQQGQPTGYPSAPSARAPGQSRPVYGQKSAAGYPYEGYAGGQEPQQPVDLDAAGRGFDGDLAGQPWPSMDDHPTALPPSQFNNHLDNPHLAGGVDHDGAHQFGDPAHQGGEFEAAYGDEEYEYEEDEPAPRRGRTMVAAMATGTVVVLGMVFYGYNIVIGDSGSKTPPVIKSADAPSKVKPLDAGGKKFAHADSKIMGRLGDGSSSESELDSNGSRKVSTLVVGRDGSIQAPPPSTDMSGSATPVPGLTVVDAFGSSGSPSDSSSESNSNSDTVTTTAALPELPQENPSPSPSSAPATPSAPKVVNSDDASSSSASSSSGSSEARQVARATPAPEPSRPATTTTGNGYVAVLASIPKSGSSRMAALERFADLQQQYSSTLNGRTPDVAEADLGAKGTYHRLVVGPPGSSQSASALCSELKQAGYSDCWVTAY